MEVDKLFNLLKLFLVSLLVTVFMLKGLVLLWWRPRKIEEHFSKQGIRGPPYRFLVGNAKELVSLMLKASSQSMSFSDHNILPRVLPFYHHWKKIYGEFFFKVSIFPLPSSLFSISAIYKTPLIQQRFLVHKNPIFEFFIRNFLTTTPSKKKKKSKFCFFGPHVFPLGCPFQL